MKKKIIIAIDGYSSCGKSTFAKAIANKLNYIFIDSGAMYRAVTLWCIENNVISTKKFDRWKVISSLPEINISFVYCGNNMTENCVHLNGRNVDKEIRSMEVNTLVSDVSIIPEVRYRLVELQRQMGSEKGIVMDGRDIGTVVFPEAELKIFMTASHEIRAMRRYNELKGKGMEIDLTVIKENIANRDFTDEHRPISPLKKAADAVVLDNSEMTVEDQMEWVMQMINSKINGGNEN